VFYDDLFSFDLERRRWFALRLKKAAGSGGRRRKKKDEIEVEEKGSANESDEDTGKDGEAVSSGWDFDKLRHDMFAFIDANGNIVYEKIEDDDDTDNKTPQDAITLDTEVESGPESIARVDLGVAANENQSKPSDAKKSKTIQSSAVMKVDSKGMPTSVARQTPLPRINCATAVKGNTLYIYGGECCFPQNASGDTC
jgi:hypothetical protein